MYTTVSCIVLDICITLCTTAVPCVDSTCNCTAGHVRRLEAGLLVMYEMEVSILVIYEMEVSILVMYEMEVSILVMYEMEVSILVMFSWRLVSWSSTR